MVTITNSTPSGPSQSGPVSIGTPPKSSPVTLPGSNTAPISTGNPFQNAANYQTYLGTSTPNTNSGGGRGFSPSGPSQSGPVSIPNDNSGGGASNPTPNFYQVQDQIKNNQYSEATDIPKINTFAKDIALSQNQRNISDIYSSPSFKGASGILEPPPKPSQSFAQRIGSFFSGIGQKGNRPTAPANSYNAYGYISPSPTGRGTIINPRTSGISTTLDVAQVPLTLANLKVQGIQNNIIDKQNQLAQQQIDERTKVYQNLFKSGAYTADEANKYLTDEINQINDNLNSNIDTQINSNQDYQKAIKESGAVQNAVANKISSQGLNDYQTSPSIIAKDIIRNPTKYNEQVQQFVNPAYFVGNALVGKGNTETIVSSKPGEAINPSIRTTPSGYFNQALAFGTLGFIGAGELKLAVKDAEQENALNILNERLRTGEQQITPDILKTKKIVVDIPANTFSGTPAKSIVLDIPKPQLIGLKTILKNREAFNNAANLGRKTQFQLAGTIDEKKIFQPILEQANPDLAANIQNLDVGTYSTLKPNGKVEQGYIARMVNQLDTGGGKAVTYVFRTTKDGNLVRPRVIETDLSSGISQVLRQKYPSELKNFNVNVEGNNPLNVFETSTFKPEGNVIKIVSKNTIQTTEGQNKILRQIDTLSNGYDIGKSLSKTRTAEQILNPKENNLAIKAFKIKEIKSVFAGSSRRIEIMQKNADNLLADTGFTTDSGADIFTQLGTQRKGLSFEKGFSQEVSKPIEFSKLGKGSANPNDFSYLKINKGIELSKTNNVFPNSKVNANIKNVLDEIPSYLGGTGKVGSEYANRGLSSVELETAFPKFKAPKTPSIKNLPETSNFFELPSVKRSGKIQFGNLLKEQKITINDFGALSNPSRSKHALDLNKQLENNNIKFGDLFKINTRSNTKQNYGLGQDLNQNQAQINTPALQIPNFQIPEYQNQKYKPIKNPYPDITFPDLFPSPKDNGSGNNQFKKAMRKGKKASKAYTSSLGAAAFQEKPINVTKKQFEALSNTTFSGLETRPVLNIVPDNQVKKQLKIKKVKF